MMADLLTFENLANLGVLIFLQAVLGFDNLLYVSLESKRVEESKQQFVRRVGKTIPGIGGTVAEVVNAYNRIVYGRGKATQKDVAAAGTLWNAMQ